jgi:omega-hydroxy-beta-dihydromenaquinone-9 sulfotransferase
LYNTKLFLTLLINTFSFNRKSLRFLSLKRIVAVVLVLPLYLVTFTINWIFLLLDEVLFPRYRKLEIKKAAFIIGVPRSATTHLFNVLYHDQQNFHGFKLWELIFAPSICQKHFYLLIRGIDRKIGSPVYKLTLLFDKAFFGKFVNIHDIGLTKPEEDEVLFLYNLSSLYFFYFWPELKVLDNLFYHDLRLPDAVKKRNINFYYRCIQRHNFVFDRHSAKYFLSKNPTFIPRMESIAEKFANARIIYPLRTPYSTIPSTISLNAHILSNFCKLPEEYPFICETRDFVLDWYEIAERTLNKTIKERYLKVNYDQITTDAEGLLSDLYIFLELDSEKEKISPGWKQEIKSEYISRHIYPKDLGIDKELINERLKNIVPPEMLNII